MLEKFGADALRLYVMSVAPPEKEVEWTDTGLAGSFRFLARVWRLVDHWNETVGGEGIESPDQCESLNAAEKALRRKTHDTIRRVTADIEQRQQLNTAVSALIELVNELYAFSEKTLTGAPGRRAEEDVEHVGEVERKETICVIREAVEVLIRMLSPFAPHIAEELWEMLGYEGGLAGAVWPAYDAEVAKAEEIVVPVQVNGKVRGRLTVPAEASEDELEALALADTAVQPHLAGKTVKKVVVARGRLVSIVVQ
jgi:leucyl-tRNA synthetase